MRLKRVVVSLIVLFLMFGFTTQTLAMVHPTESVIFTTDADASEVKRVAFFIECDEEGTYYQEVEGYIFPNGTKITIDDEVYSRKLYIESCYFSLDYSGYSSDAGWPYGGFGECESNTIAIESTNSIYEVAAKKDGHTEWLFFASDALNPNCYRVLKEGETVDSRRRVAKRLCEINLYDNAGNHLGLTAFPESVQPVTFEVNYNGTEMELDGFIVDGSRHISGTVQILGWEYVLQQREDAQLDQSPSDGIGVGNGWYEGSGATDELSLFTFGSLEDGIWIASDEMVGISYREREVRTGEMEVISPESVEEIEPVHLNKLNNYLNTAETGENIKKVLFHLGEEKKEGYVFTSGSYVGLNKEIFQKGLYDEGSYKVAEDGTIGVERRSLVKLFDIEGVINSGNNLYHVDIIDPETGENVDVYFAFDTINPNSYEVLEVGVLVEETEPDVQEPETETQESESEDVTTENLPMDEEQMEEEKLEEQGGLPAEGSIVEVSAIAVAATVFAGVISAAGAGIMPNIEVSSGVKARRGELHVNGDVDVPDVHFDNLEKLVVSVHVSDGEGIVWAIVANAFTPGIKDLVKATAVPAGTDGANINLKVADDFKDKVKEETTVYLEVVATGFDVNGECNLLEKMVEIKIVTK